MISIILIAMITQPHHRKRLPFQKHPLLRQNHSCSLFFLQILLHFSFDAASLWLEEWTPRVVIQSAQPPPAERGLFFFSKDNDNDNDDYKDK